MLKTQEKDKLWDLRQRQNLAELMPLLAQYKLQYPEDQELLCLDASLLRARGAIDGAQEKLKQLRTEVAQEALNPRLFMEEGLNFLYQGDSYQGLEKFLTCFSLIKNRPEEINLAMQALINAMISLDNLGQSFAYTESEFTKITFNKTIPQNYTSTIEMLHLYKKFRQGDMASIDRQVVSKAGQAQFFKYYISSMPYHRFYLPKSVAAEMEGILINTSELYLKSYRFRTLQKILHPDDETNKKISEVIDRLYLWVWHFMIEPTEGLWSRIVVTLNHLEKLSSSHLSLDDSEKIQCAIGWLGIIDPRFEKSKSKLLSLFRMADGGAFHQVHQLEKLVINYYQASRDGDKHIITDYKNAIKIHPLYEHQHLHFKYLVDNENENDKDDGHEDFKKIKDHLRSTIPVKNKYNKKTASLLIDLRTFRIQKEENDFIVSENMCLALDLLNKNNQVSENDFFKKVFNIDEFDPVIHNSKLFTLLWRLKKICHGHIDIKVKNGKIFALGNWKRITFEQRPLIMQIMHAKNPNFFKNYSDASTINKDAKLDKIKTSEFILSINESLSRSDIEKRIGKSRPTCNRYLNKWRIAGLLEIIGSGPATRYRISQNIEYRGKHE